MKRLIILGLTGTLLAIGNAASADPPSTPDEKTSVEARRDMPGAMIDDIVVPYEVMVYVETKYPGHTVTEAREAIHKNKAVYRLRIDNDIFVNDRESVILYYDKNWKLLDTDKMVAPRPKPKPSPEPVEEDDKKPVPQEPDSENPRGGGNDENGEKPEPEKPEEPVSNGEDEEDGTVTDSTVE